MFPAEITVPSRASAALLGSQHHKIKPGRVEVRQNTEGNPLNFHPGFQTVDAKVIGILNGNRKDHQLAFDLKMIEFDLVN